MLELIKLFTWATYLIYLVSIASGVFVCISAVSSMNRLKGTPSTMMQPDNTPIHTITRFVFGVFLIANNMIAMYSIRSLGADESYVYDPFSVLGYMNGASVDSDEQMLALFALTMSRTLGAIAITSGIKHGRHIAHPQEQVRQSARLRLSWSLPCSLIFIYPEFWIDFASNYYSNAAYISGLIKGL